MNSLVSTVSTISSTVNVSRSTLLARRMILLRSRYARVLYRSAQSARMAGRLDHSQFTMRQAARLYASVAHASATIAAGVEGVTDSVMA